MRSYLVGLDVWFLVGAFAYFHTLCVQTVMRRLAWAFAGRLCGKYHNLMSWLNKCQTEVDGFIYLKIYLPQLNCRTLDFNYLVDFFFQIWCWDI